LIEGFTFKVASEPERRLALNLRRQVYRTELGHDGIDSFDDRAYHLIACTANGDVVASLRIVGPESRPFDLESVAPLIDLLGPSRRLGEISRFCIKPDLRHLTKGQSIHLGMFKLAYEFALRHSLTDFVTLALPHLSRLYSMALFRPLMAEIKHPTWGPVQLMHLDLMRLADNRSSSADRMARFLLGPTPSNFTI